jgi:cytochrome c peroxidase
MPRVRLFPAASRLSHSPFALAPPGGRLFGVFGVLLAFAGLALLGVASMPLIAGATEKCTDASTGNPPCFFVPEDEEGTPIGSLKGVDKPTDPDLVAGGPYIRNQDALIALGKAFFWDQQVGSDGQACGTCHFTAGADGRTRNQISPGLKAQPTEDHTFQVGQPNHELTSADFPIHKLVNPAIKSETGSNVVRDANDVISSAGVFNRDFQSIQSNPVGSMNAPRPAFDTRAFDNCTSVSDPQGFKVGDVNVRRVEPRNTPTMINAMFTNRNFWDSRAQGEFNGVDPFGKRNADAVVFVNNQDAVLGQPEPVHIHIANSSLASQAAGPPLSDFEMSCRGRTFPDVGHKLLVSTPTPLAQQDVAPNDSVLGRLSNARFGAGSKGLAVKYADLIALSFQPRWWGSIRPVNTGPVTGSRPQIEANFSLFWGLSVQAYMETLRADRTPVDSFFDGAPALTPSQLRGLKIFESACTDFNNNGGCVTATRPDLKDPTIRVKSVLADNSPADLRCTTCHGGPETTGASIDAVVNDARLERMAMASNQARTCAIYDAGHFNTGVRRTNDDIALGANDPFGNAFGETQLLLDQKLLRLTNAVAPFGLVPPIVFARDGTKIQGTTNCDGANVMGTFKAPQLRNVELTGPYFHNGGQLTLRQVIDFYNRGGDFNNTREFDPNVHPLHLGETDKNDLVAFLIALTDERVAYERAPFDHPGIVVADGASGTESSVELGDPLPGGGTAKRAKDHLLVVPAVGENGRATRLTNFLKVNEFSPTK